MQTTTHSILAMALLAKKDQPLHNRAVLFGSLIPDAFIYICWAYLTMNGVSQGQIWNEIYFQANVQFWGGFIQFRFPIYSGLALIGWFTRSKKYGGLLLAFALAALSHMATDFPFHANDAHMHFWRLSSWRFHSPVSYWDPAYYGRITGLLETMFGLGLLALLLRRFKRRATRITLSLFFGL